jgi:hypothetical protein
MLCENGLDLMSMLLRRGYVDSVPIPSRFLVHVEWI